METRVSHLLIGSFVLAFIAMMIAFAIWMTKVDPNAEYKEYDIYFTGSVSGLVNRGTVFYLGIPVGEVRKISLAPDPRKVKVMVRLLKEVPVNNKSRAHLEFQGLTGVAYIEIMGGDPGAEPLKIQAGQKRPVIESETSNFQAIFEKAPNLVDEAVKAVVATQDLLGPENQKNIAGILKNSNQLTANLAKGTENLDQVMQQASVLMGDVNKTVIKINKLADTGSQLLEEDVTQMLHDAKSTMAAISSMAQRLDGMIKANEGAVTTFVNGTLPEVSRMVMDLRATSRSLSRLMMKIETNPAHVVFPPKSKKYNAETGTIEEDK